MLKFGKIATDPTFTQIKWVTYHIVFSPIDHNNKTVLYFIQKSTLLFIDQHILLFLCTAGLNPNMNVNCMEVGGLSLKEPPQPQSRLSQWTHSNSMDSLSGNSSSMENNLNKHGASTLSFHPSIPPFLHPSTEKTFYLTFRATLSRLRFQSFALTHPVLSDSPSSDTQIQAYSD